MRTITIIVLVASGVLLGCGSTEATTEPPGSPAVHTSIAQETDCSALQESFDRAADNWDLAEERGEGAGPGSVREYTLAYMEAADDRMAAIGCYEGP